MAVAKYPFAMKELLVAYSVDETWWTEWIFENPVLLVLDEAAEETSEEGTHHGDSA